MIRLEVTNARIGTVAAVFVLAAGLTLRPAPAQTTVTQPQTAPASPATEQAEVQQTPTHRTTIHLDPGSAKIHWLVRDTMRNVNGTFQLKGGLLTFNPATGVADGELLVDVATGTTGNATRDNKIKTQVLEAQKYPTLFFHPTLVTGTLKPGSSQQLSVDGTLNIHGADHPLTLKVNVTVQGSTVNATTRFTVPYVAWGMKDPSLMLLRYSRQVEVDVTAHGTIEGAP